MVSEVKMVQITSEQSVTLPKVDKRIRITEEVIQTIAALEDRKGRLQPDDVLEEAESPDSPLHPFFEWDDSAAARAFRLSQARVLITRVKIVVTKEDIELKFPKYIRDVERSSEEQGYIQVVRVQTKSVNATMADELNGAVSLLTRALTFAEIRRDHLPEGTVESIGDLIRQANEIIENLA